MGVCAIGLEVTCKLNVDSYGLCKDFYFIVSTCPTFSPTVFQLE